MLNLYKQNKQEHNVNVSVLSRVWLLASFCLYTVTAQLFSTVRDFVRFAFFVSSVYFYIWSLVWEMLTWIIQTYYKPAFDCRCRCAFVFLILQSMKLFVYKINLISILYSIFLWCNFIIILYTMLGELCFFLDI